MTRAFASVADIEVQLAEPSSGAFGVVARDAENAAAPTVLRGVGVEPGNSVDVELESLSGSAESHAEHVVAISRESPPPPAQAPRVPALREALTVRLHDPLAADPGRDAAFAGPSAGSTPDAMAPFQADPLIGLIVAERYRIVEQIGRGGMGIIYKVQHCRIGKLLAMKLLAGELSARPDVIRRFKREALMVSRLSSPNTVQVFDFGVFEGLTYLIMELVAGENLHQVLRSGGPMPFARLGAILVQVCSSIAEAHRHGIVHRDLKPENIMVIKAHDGTDVAKVLDFGLAKLREDPELNAVTSHGVILGTPYYMAPEQASGDLVDGRADVYALGVVMYRALTGVHVFQGPGPMALLAKHISERPIPPEVRAPDLGISPAVSRIVMRAIEKRPEDRFQRIEEMQAAILEELRQLGETSIEILLDSGVVRGLADVKPPESHATAIATRDEVEAYERKLRRMRHTAIGSATVTCLAAALIGGRLLMLPSQPGFTGVEVEPNNTAAEATPVPFGQPVTGYLGKRLDSTHGDRDLYGFEVPAPSGLSSEAAPLVRLSFTALPNFATCALLYRAGVQTALAQLCVGRAGRDLLVPALRLDPGRYFIAAIQDLDGYGGPTPFVHENISDGYTLRVELTEPPAGGEIEPNNDVASAAVLEPGASMSGALAWSGDEDVVCARPNEAAPIRWRVEDAQREAGVVLEVVPIGRNGEGAPVRIHAGPMLSKAPDEHDARSPWSSEVIGPDEQDELRCLRLRLSLDPWTSEHRPIQPSGSGQPYVVELEPGP